MYEEMKEPKKKNSFWKKALASICFGVFFGIFAGLGFFGIKLAYEVLPIEEALVAVGLKEEPEEVKEIAEEIESETSEEEPEEGGEIEEIEPEGIAEDVWDVADVAEQTMPAIVSITLKADVNYYGYVQEVEAAGSGIIVGKNERELLVVTNYHVIEDGKEIKVQFCDGTEGLATVRGQDVSMDLAVVVVPLEDLSVETMQAIKIIKLGDSETLKVGQPAIAIGNSLGYGQSVTTGVISALDREMTTENGEKGIFIQTDAAINQGNSGGALLNMKGELIGINSNKLGGTYVEGMGYAIPISAAEPIISELMEKKELVALPEEEQSYLGISGADVSSGTSAQTGVPTPVGVYVADVVKDGPADAAGIQRGDIITRFEGNSITGMTELQEYLAAYSAGSKVKITYKRLKDSEYVEFECEVVLQNKSS